MGNGVTNADPWAPRQAETGRTLTWEIGETLFHARHTGDEWRVARQAAGAEGGDMIWKRWAAGTEEKVLTPAPVMPDRSVIVRPEAPIHLAPGYAALFFVSIPVWFRLTAGADRALTLCDEPVVLLSSIWHGDPTAGELCYSLRTRARREDTTEPSAGNAHRAVCKLTMRNDSTQPVEFQRLCLPARHLNLYRGAQHLWTDDVTVVFVDAAMNRVRIAGCPREAADKSPIGPAREVLEDGHILQRGFNALRAILG